MTADAELRLVQSMARSRYWTWMRGYLIDRRETLLRTPADTDALMHQQKGALNELTRMLSAPELVAKYLAEKAKTDADEQREPEAPEVPTWLETAKQGGMTVD